MPKKKSKDDRPSKNKKVRHEVLGIITIGLGIFAFLSIYTSSAGIAGSSFRKVLMGLFGIAGYSLPFIISLAGVFIIISDFKKARKARLILLVTSSIFIMCIIHLLYFKYFESGDLYDFVKSSYIQGLKSKGAGAILAAFVFWLYKLFGIPGSYLLLIILFLIDLLLLTNLSLKQVSKSICTRMNLWKGEKSKKKLEGCTDEDSGGEALIEGQPEEGDDRKELVSKESILPEAEKFNEQDKIKIIDFEKEKSTRREGKECIAVDSGGGFAGSEKRTVTPYKIPPLTLLKESPQKQIRKNYDRKILNNAKILEETLSSFGVKAKVVQVSRGPAITRYELQPSPGVKVSRIVNLADDIALNLAASGVRIEAPIPGKAAIGVEVPNQHVIPVLLREVLESNEFISHPSKLAFALGKDIAGKNIVADIARMPHLLIAGATGSGKSVCINSLIISLLYKATPQEVKLIMIDPKVVELSNYNGIPHLMIPVVTDPKKAAGALNWAVQEMINRYKLFADKSVRDIERYNEIVEGTDESKLSQIVIIIDELADLMMVAPKDVEDAICRLAQMARAAGIHLVIATQRPSVDVITGVIKANIPSRIAFAVSSQADSRTILDMGGAEKLLGRGDMLYYPVGASKPIRVQGCYISEKEVETIVEYIKKQNKTPEYNTDVVEEINTGQSKKNLDGCDELLPEAIQIVVDAGQASISMLQRRLRIGYARAARLIDEMEARGIVSGFEGSKPREVLISKEEFEQMYK